MLKAEADTLSFWVDGLCGMCKIRIEGAAKKVPGVAMAEYDVHKNLLRILPSGNLFSGDKLQQAVAAIGHDTEKYKADSLVYAKLHECCHYRDPLIRADHLDKLDASATVTGKVFTLTGTKGRDPAMGASVYWEGTNLGVYTNENGVFEIPRAGTTSLLVFTYVGEIPDSVDMRGMREIEIILGGGGFELKPIEITYRKKTSSYSFLSPLKVQVLGEGELAKAACCNLSESFETTPSIDVSITDAVTGTRQIEMLGLSGASMAITRENIPDIRGLSAIYGLTYLPGPWIEEIQLSPGTGSVANGFESITGQINVELKKPQSAERVYFNAYANEMGRFEANLSLSHSLQENLHTGLLLHARTQTLQSDRNNDHFMDGPIGDQIIVANRWHFASPNGLQGQVGLKGTFIRTLSGQLNGKNHIHPGGGPYLPWLADMDTRRAEGWYKLGYVFPNKPKTSLGLQLAALEHDQKSLFGKRRYDALQQSLYANLLFQTILGSTDHGFRTGLSFQADRFDEFLGDIPFLRREAVPGVFSEYTYQFLDKLTLVAGLRADQHNQYGFFLTPRMNLRFSPNAKTTLRLQTGRGQRTPSLIAEQVGALASARVFQIRNPRAGIPYGLNPEIAWNTGLGILQEFQFSARPATLSTEIFHIRFINQVVADFDADPQRMYFYNLEGRSFSTHFQTQLDVELFPRFDVRLAYRFQDVKATYLAGLRQRPFISRHKAFANLAWESKRGGWKFDATLQVQGPRRLPDLVKNPAAVFATTQAPAFAILNAQVSKTFGKSWEFYLGVENALNFRQRLPIISADDPYSEWFDGSVVWGPIFGRMTYAGMRFRLFRKGELAGPSTGQ